LNTTPRRSRRAFLHLTGLGALGATLGACAAPFTQATTPALPAEGPVAGPDDALRRLVEGNQRYAASQSTDLNESAARRAALTGGQSPFATIFSCVDSRVPPELVFDQGLGDLFDVRTAGHVVGDMELGSIEYAAEHLHTPLVVVMGHQKCGAVTAAADGGAAAGHLPSLIALIRPAIDAARSRPGDLIDNAVRINVENVVRQVRESTPVLSALVAHGELTVVGAVYSLDTGKVEWLTPARSSASASAVDPVTESCPEADRVAYGRP